MCSIKACNMFILCLADDHWSTCPCIKYQVQFHPVCDGKKAAKELAVFGCRALGTYTLTEKASNTKKDSAIKPTLNQAKLQDMIVGMANLDFY